MSGPVGELMQGCAVIARRFFERALRRKMDAVLRSAVECAVILIVRDFGSRAGEDGLASFGDLKLRAFRQFVTGYVVDLPGVEDGIDPMDVASPVRLGSAIPDGFLAYTRNRPDSGWAFHVPEFNLGPLFAAADLPSLVGGLFVRHPTWIVVTGTE